MEPATAIRGALRGGYRAARKRAKRLASHLWFAWYRARNRFSRAMLTGTAPTVVSLTTFGTRADVVYVAIESIGAGRVRPRRLVLWLDDPRIIDNLPATLRRLQRRGLEIHLTDNLGPHTKYYPSLTLEGIDGLPLVTADDDILYPHGWLADLLAASRAHPAEVCCHRAFVVATRGTGLAPYSTWPNCRTTQAGPMNFATGVSGVLYPPAMLAALRGRGTAFMATTPKADDVWLHWVALREGIPVRQVRPKPRHFPFIPGTQEVGLVNQNVGEGANDRWIAATYDETDVARLVAAGAPER